MDFVHATHEERNPGGTLVGAGDARRRQTIAWKPRRFAERDFQACTQPFQVAPHVATLGRIDIERRIIPTLLLKNRAEKKWTPLHDTAVAPGELFDSHRRRVRVGAGEIEPKFDFW